MTHICDVEGCTNELGEVAGALTWRRYLSEQEIAALVAAGEVPPATKIEGAYTTVKACPEHAIHIDLATYIHDNTCTAPPACDCSQAGKGPFIGEDEV